VPSLTPTTSSSPKMGFYMPPRYANGHIYATGHSIHLYSAHRAVMFALAQLCCYRRVRYCHSMSSVHSSVTLGNCDHTVWNSSKIIWRIYSLCRPQQYGSILKGTPWNFGRNRDGYWKGGFRCTKALISLERGNIGPTWLLSA